MLRYLPAVFLVVWFYSVLPVSALASHEPSDAVNSRVASVDKEGFAVERVETFPVPILFGVTYDALAPDFGASRGGGTRAHQGQDIRAPKSTPVVSPTKAVVTGVGEGASAGKYVYTANPGGESFRYLHLDSIADIKLGDTLEVGDMIGTVGDTGNVPAGIYHLHFEVKNTENEPIDPYQRLGGTPFTQTEKMKFVAAILDEVEDADEYARVLVNNFPSEFTAAALKKYSLPPEVDEPPKNAEENKNNRLRTKLDELMALIPTVIPTGLSFGDSTVATSLLQTYLIFTTEGPARNTLAAATATGYFGSITTAALKEYQADNGLNQTGEFDEATKEKMSK